MRRFVAVSLLLVPAAMPLSAQFEGTISMTMSTHSGGNSADMQYLIKGHKIAYTMSSPMAPGQQVRMIMDLDAQKTIMLIPVAMGDTKGMMMTIDLKQAAAHAAKQAPPVVTALGTSQTIAGYRCSDFEMTDKKNVTRMCISQDLGRFAFSGGRGGGAAAPDWTRAFGDKPGFPLKVWTADGKVSMEVTSVHKGSVPDSVFAIPDGYKDMSGMMGMGRRGGGDQ